MASSYKFSKEEMAAIKAARRETKDKRADARSCFLGVFRRWQTPGSAEHCRRRNRACFGDGQGIPRLGKGCTVPIGEGEVPQYTVAPHKPIAKIFLFFIDKTSLSKNYSCPLEDSYNITKQLGYSLHGLWILDGVVYRLLTRQFKPKQYTIVYI